MLVPEHSAAGRFSALTLDSRQGAVLVNVSEVFKQASLALTALERLAAMDCLPDEDILKILEFLDLRDRQHLAQVNSRILSLARTEVLWRNAALTITETQVLLCVNPQFPPSSVSNVGDYSEHLGRYVHSLHLTIDIPFGFDKSLHARVEKIVNALKLTSLKTLTLSFPDFCNLFEFGTFFNTIKSTLQTFDITSKLPNVSLHFVEEMCKTEPPRLRELLWMHGPDLRKPPDAWLASLMLEAIVRDSKNICCTQEDVDQLCHSLKLCGNPLVFRTNILNKSLLEAFSKVTRLITFTLVLVVDEASLWDGLSGEEFPDASKVCKELDMVLQVTSSEPGLVWTLGRLPAALPVKGLQLKLADCQNLLGVGRLLRLAVEKFARSLATVQVGIHQGRGPLTAQAVEWLKKQFPGLAVTAG